MAFTIPYSVLHYWNASSGVEPKPPTRNIPECFESNLPFYITNYKASSGSKCVGLIISFSLPHPKVCPPLFAPYDNCTFTGKSDKEHWLNHSTCLAIVWTSFGFRIFVHSSKLVVYCLHMLATNTTLKSQNKNYSKTVLLRDLWILHSMSLGASKHCICFGVSLVQCIYIILNFCQKSTAAEFLSDACTPGSPQGPSLPFLI